MRHPLCQPVVWTPHILGGYSSHIHAPQGSSSSRGDFLLAGCLIVPSKLLWEVESPASVGAGESGVQGHFPVQRKFEISLDYRRPYLKVTTNNNTKMKERRKFLLGFSSCPWICDNSIYTRASEIPVFYGGEAGSPCWGWRVMPHWQWQCGC